MKLYEVIYLCKYLSGCCQILQCCSCLYKVMYDQVLILCKSIWPTGGHLEFLKIYKVIYLCKYLSDCCQILQCCSCLYKLMYYQVLIPCKSILPTGGHLENLRNDISLPIFKRLLSNFTMLSLSIQIQVFERILSHCVNYNLLKALTFAVGDIRA